MDLSGSQVSAFIDALITAFPTKPDLARMLYTGLNRSLDAVVSTDGSLTNTVFNLIIWAQAQGIVANLLTAALEANPDNPKLREFAAQVGEPVPTGTGGSATQVELTWQQRRDLLSLLERVVTTPDLLLVLCVWVGVPYAGLDGDDLTAKRAALLGVMDQRHRTSDLDGAANDLAARQGQAAQEAAARPGIVVASLKQAVASKATGPATPEQVQAITSVVNEAVAPPVVRRLAGAQVLWVDDHPENNVYERKALEPLGIRFLLGRSTDEGLSVLQKNTFDVVISDLGRGPDRRAGLTLLGKMQTAGSATPLIIYCGAAADDPGIRAAAKEAGAYGITNNPQELFQLVTQAILQA